MSDNDDDHSEEDDSVEALFSPIKLDHILRALYFGSALQVVLSIATLIVASRSDNAHASQTNFIASGIIIAASLVSMYSCFYRDRGGLQWSYLLLVWAVGNGTRYLYAALLDTDKLAAFCNSSNDEITANCGEQQGLAAAQMGLAVIQFFASLTNAWLTSNLSEKIQDHENIVQRKKDIRFALAAQAQKQRTIKKWKNAFQSVSLGSKLKKKVGLMKGGSEMSLGGRSVPNSKPAPMHVVSMTGGKAPPLAPVQEGNEEPVSATSTSSANEPRKVASKPSPLSPLASRNPGTTTSYTGYASTDNLDEAYAVGIGLPHEDSSHNGVTQRNVGGGK